MVSFNKLRDKKVWCVVCDNDYAEYEISSNGDLRPFWLNPNDGEICLCKDCAKDILKKMKEALDKEIDM